MLSQKPISKNTKKKKNLKGNKLYKVSRYSEINEIFTDGPFVLCLMYHFLKITLALAFRSSMLDVFIWLLGEEWLHRNIHYIPKNQRNLPRSKFCILPIDMDSAVTKKITRNVISNSTSVYIGNPLWSQLSYLVFIKWYFFQISYRALKEISSSLL